MVVVVKKNAAETQIENIIQHLKDFGFDTHRSDGAQRTIIGAIGVQPDFDIRKVRVIDGVADVYRITDPYKLASRSFRAESTVLNFKNVEIGGKDLAIIAGPCSIENEEQIFHLAEVVSNSGAKILRGGAFKPRTSPYSFQGLGEEGLKLIREAADKYNLLVITEVLQLS